MKGHRFAILALAAALALSIGIAVFAEEGDYAYREDPFQIYLGGQLLNVNTKTKVKGTLTGEGTSIDIDKDLGLDSSNNTWRVDASWRFFDRHQFQFAYFNVDRSGDKTLQRSFVYDGYDYNVGAYVHTEMDTDFWALSYNYYFFQAKRGEFGAYLGLTYSDIDLSLTLDAVGSGGGHHAQVGYAVTKSLAKPTATLGLAGTYQFTPKCFFRGSAGWLRLNTGGYTGTVWSLKANFDYYPWQNVGFGASYQAQVVDIDSDQDRWNGYIRSGMDGLYAYVAFKF